VNLRHWSLPLGGLLKAIGDKCVLKCCQEKLNESDERTESGMETEFQIVAAAAR